jgi:hypothetical protein
MKKINFKAKMKLGENNPIYTTIDFCVNINDNDTELSLLWDDVIDSLYEKCTELKLYDDFPNADYDTIEIITDDGIFPVISEDDFKNDNFKSCGKKILVLPFATYTLSDEFKSYLKLKEQGLIDFEFDADRIKSIEKIFKN